MNPRTIDRGRRVALAWLLCVVLVGGCARLGPAPNAATINGATISAPPVRPGVEAFVESPPVRVLGTRVGLITNHTGVDRAGRSGVDLIHAMQSVQLVALFSPEHGLRGTAGPGETVGSGTDEKTGLPVYSLYGDTRKPTPDTLKHVDALLFDIQDVGARPYTYVYTMALAMQAARDKRIPFVVLDRPNPIGGDAIEGNLLEPALASFVGMYPIPMRHGMTAGELAKLFSHRFGIGGELIVVPVENWRRSAWYDATGLPWVSPSPNLPRLESAVHYPGTVLFEGTNLSVGRGSDRPFEQVGAPWLDGAAVADAMNSAGLPGVTFVPVRFTPVAPGDNKFAGKPVEGVRLAVTDRQAYRPVNTAVRLVAAVRRLHPRQFQWRAAHFDRLAGTDRLRLAIEAGRVEELLREWDDDAARFRLEREPYLLYP